MKCNERKILFAGLSYVLTGLVFALCLFGIQRMSSSSFLAPLPNPIILILLWPVPFIQRLIEEGFMWYHLLSLILFAALLEFLVVQAERRDGKQGKRKPPRR